MSGKESGGDAAPKKSKKKLIIIVLAAVLLLGGGGGADAKLGSSPPEKPLKPEPGVVVALDAVTINHAITG